MANHKPCKYRTEMLGKKFGRLLVVSEIPKEDRKRPGEREFICKCDCGNERRVKISNLKSGNSKSCGCLEKELIAKRNVEKLLGKRFGRLVVIDYERDYLRPDRYRYICRCDCGNIHTSIASDLIRGMTRSCGCYRKEFHSKRMTDDITGKTFNELTAIKQVDTYISKSNYRFARWLFRCSCGKEIIAFAGNVRNGKTMSCGHLGDSAAEYYIRKWLIEHNIPFEKECGFDDLRNIKTGRKLLFDFKVYRKDGTFFLIEHQGAQHFVERPDNVNFGKQQREQTDQIKKDYCEEKGITLYETLYNKDYIAKIQEIISKELWQEGETDEKEVKCG